MSASYSSRRSFLKTSAVGAAGLAVGGLLTGKSEGAWATGMQINPSIDNLRVVCCHDAEMVAQTPLNFDNFATVNNSIAASRVSTNLDTMAIRLAEMSTPAEAWAAIIRKPAAKQWSEVKVAIKVNCIEPRNMPRVAIIDKLSRVLNSLGVPYASIIIYDGCTNAGGKYDTTAIKAMLPSGITVSSYNNALQVNNQGQIQTSVPGFTGTYACTAQIASGAIDILINIAVNKGHSNTVTGATLCCKNHFGTFDPGPIKSFNTTGAVFSINKSDAIIGGTPPRQQLCIVDSLFASVAGPDGSPDYQPDRIVMGTFAPAVDFLTIKKIREPLMGADHDSSIVARYATDFGYTIGQFNALNFVDAVPVGVDPSAGGPAKSLQSGGVLLNFVVLGSGFITTSAALRFAGEPGPLKIEILDLSGKIVTKLAGPSFTKKNLTIEWNGTANGLAVPAGRYVVRAVLGGQTKTSSFSLVLR